MPIYEYQCPKCLTSVERIHDTATTEYVICPRCKIGMNKLISSPSLLVIK